MPKVTDCLEQQELIDKLVENGYKDLVDALLGNVYTKKGKGRLNKSAACRLLSWKSKQFEDALSECRKILGEDTL